MCQINVAKKFKRKIRYATAVTYSFSEFADFFLLFRIVLTSKRNLLVRLLELKLPQIFDQDIKLMQSYQAQ